jgi:hypothetical protein
MIGRKGLPVYGFFVLAMDDGDVMLAAMRGKPYRGGEEMKHRSVRAIEEKRMPPGGPTHADLGEGQKGIAVYEDEDEDDDIDIEESEGSY